MTRQQYNRLVIESTSRRFDRLIAFTFQNGMSSWFTHMERPVRIVKFRLMTYLLAIIFFPLLAKAQEADKSPGYDELMKDFSKIDPSSIGSNNCEINQILDFDKYRLGMENIREEWLYKDHTVESYQRTPYQVLYTVGRKWATLITQSIYLNAKAKSCRFTLFISDQDKYGNNRPITLVSWNFTRELSNKTRWDALDDKQFPNLALGWKWGADFASRAAREGRR